MGIRKLTPPTIFPSTSTQTIKENLRPVAIVTGDSDLVAGNVKSGVNLFNIEGAFGLSTVTAGNNQLSSNPAEYTNGTGTYQKLKETQVTVSGSLRISYDARINDTQYCEVALYVNGVLRGLTRKTTDGVNISTSYKTFTEDITGINSNDFIQIWARTNGNAGTIVSVKNLVISVNENTSLWASVIK